MKKIKPEFNPEIVNGEELFLFLSKNSTIFRSKRITLPAFNLPSQSFEALKAYVKGLGLQSKTLARKFKMINGNNFIYDNVNYHKKDII